jgi:molybdopterin synthase sulfur carrier subunit
MMLDGDAGRENADAAQIRVTLPYHLRNLARVQGDVIIEVPAPVTLRATLDALEARYPMLRGTIRDYETGQRRPFLRFFASAEDISLASPESELPEAVSRGAEPLLIIGAIAGG